MINNSLTKNEKLVLHGLVRYPLSNNRELSETIDLKQSTVTAIHRKLKNKGYIRTVRIPLLQNLGCEMLAVTYSVFSSSMPLKTRLRISKDIADKYDEIFWAVSETTQGISLQLSRNYTDVKENKEELEKVYCKQNVTRGPTITLLLFPFRLASIANFFDFSLFLEQIFELKVNYRKKTSVYKTKHKVTHLNDTEKLIYHTLIKHPDLPDKELADVIDISRHSIARARKKFEDDALIRTIRVVDLKKLGFEILVLNHFVFNMKISPEKKEKGIEALIKNKQPIFMVMGEIDGVSLVPYKSFEDFRECSGKIADINKRYGLFSKDTTSLLFSTTTMVYINNHDYAPIVKKVLGIQDRKENTN